MAPTDAPAITAASARYLLATLRLWADHGDRVTTGEVAERLSVEPSSATEMLERLAEAGYLERYPHRGVELTPRGVSLGRSLSRRECVVQDFFFDAGAPIGAERALAVGAHLSDRAVDRLAASCEHPCLDRCRAGEEWFDGCPKLAGAEVA